jgi:hypothetical protein
VSSITHRKYEQVTRLGDWFAGRQRDRDHNQAKLIARPLARRLK